MRTVIYLCMLLIFIHSAITYEQNDYRIDFERLEIMTFNKKYFNYAKMTTFKYNRTQPAINATLDIAVPLGRNIEVIAQGYKFASNEYRLFPLRLGFNLCEALDKNEFGLNTLLQHGNFSGCPIKAERYCISNWIPDQKRFPPFIPNGNYRFYFEIMFSSEEVATLQGYGIVSRPLGRRH